MIKSLKDRIRHRFNVSIAETDAVDVCQSAVLSAVVVSNDAHFAKQCLQQVLNFIEGHRDADLIDYSLEMI